MDAHVDSRPWKEWWRDTARRWVKKYLFPDFSKRLTKYLVGAGVACVITPDVFQYLLIDWLIKTFSLNIGVKLTVADFRASSADYWVGFGLVSAALVHNLLYKWLDTSDASRNFRKEEVRRASDLALYNEFTALLPSTSWSICLLRDHDFCNTFKLESIRPIEKFINEWSAPERSFHDAELQLGIDAFMKKAREFDRLIAVESGPVGIGHQSVIPDHCRDDWNLPNDVQDSVDKINAIATDAFIAHQKFILLAKNKLGC